MIIIDEDADIRLLLALNALKIDSLTTYCIYLHLAGFPAMAGTKEKVIASIHQRISDKNAQIYLCDEGDICILVPKLTVKEGNQFILDIVDFVGAPAHESWIGFNEVSFQINKWLAAIDQRLLKQKQQVEAKRKLLVQQHAERKRQSILNQTTMMDTSTIHTRRTQRTTAELMMIEDDPFTSRLVENVLQKKYAITSLKEADYALDNYARIAPDLLFLDINLPDVTGHELLERLLALDPEAYIVMLSGNADQMNITQAMAKGAKGFIAKPFTREKLFQYLDRCPGIVAKQRVHATT
jgi:CheY-like chemotaxis protein